MYFSPPATVLKNADPNTWGIMKTPRGGVRHVPEGYLWIADNGCFAGSWIEEKWIHWLDQMTAYQQHCVMVTMPDVVGDAATTLAQYECYSSTIRRRGWRVGLVAQDGLESLPWPQDYDALFVGGSTEWKLSDAADWCIKRAKQAGKWTHVGRVNGPTRIKHFKLIGVDSVDGTGLCFNPRTEYRRIDNALRYAPLFLLDS